MAGVRGPVTVLTSDTGPYGGWADAIRARVPDLDLRVATTPEALRTLIGEAECLAGWGRRLEPDVLGRAGRLRWIHTLSAGVEDLLTTEGLPPDVWITNSRGAHAIPIAEHVLALILAQARGLPAFFAAQADRRWEQYGLRGRMDELEGRLLGLVGLGGIGEAIARKARGVGMRVWATRRRGGASPWAERILPAERLDELLAAADAVVVACPLTPETRGLFDAARFARMKPTAFFVNIARGAIVDQAALVEALATGRIAGAGLDVFEEEPLPATSPLWSMPNVILTPHTSSASPRTRERTADLWAENIRRYRAGEPLLNLVDRRLGY